MKASIFVGCLLLDFALGIPVLTPDNHLKIVGGVETTIEDVPYQLQMESGFFLWTAVEWIWQFACGGVIIGPDAVLTSGFCINGLSPQNVRFKSGDSRVGQGTIHNATKLYLHPNYQPEGRFQDFDIAVVRVEPPFNFSTTVQSIPLAEVPPQTGNNGTISGWGTVRDGDLAYSDVLRKVSMPVMDHDNCTEAFSDLNVVITSSMFCGGFLEGGKDSCALDAGGPFVVNGKLAGLISWSEGCAKPNRPRVFTNVAKFVSWITETLK